MSAAGPVLATLRGRAGLSAREAARRARVGRRYLKRVERFTLMRLADELRVLFPDRPSVRQDGDA